MFKSIYNDIKSQFDYGNNVTRLIIINAAVFVALYLVYAGIAITVGPEYPITQQKFLHYFTLPPQLIDVVKHPWTIISHMFLHEGFFHFLFNMLILFWFGRIFGDLMGDRRVIPLYILGGLMGIVFIQLGGILFDIPMGHALGASAAIMAIVVATAIVAPDYTLHLILLGPVKLKFVALVMIILDVIGIASLSNTGGHFAHIGGMVMGWLYILMVQADKDPAKWMNKSYNSFIGLFQAKAKPAKKKSPLSVKYKATVPRAKKKNVRKATMNVDHQGRLDAILEKISKKGIASLSQEEKDFLDRASKNK
jgi:membrane associated rhomboid family serine protease